jgi:hypothetical protein
MMPGIPNGARVSTYGNVEQREGFQLPGPYKLSGEVPNVMHEEVQAITSLAFKRNMLAQLHPGLAITLSCLYVQQYITFDVIDGQHRFREASGDQMLFHASDFADYLAYLATKGTGAPFNPAAPPWRPYALPISRTTPHQSEGLTG